MIAKHRIRKHGFNLLAHKNSRSGWRCWLHVRNLARRCQARELAGEMRIIDLEGHFKPGAEHGRKAVKARRHRICTDINMVLEPRDLPYR